MNTVGPKSEEFDMDIADIYEAVGARGPARSRRFPEEFLRMAPDYAADTGPARRNADALLRLHRRLGELRQPGLHAQVAERLLGAEMPDGSTRTVRPRSPGGAKPSRCSAATHRDEFEEVYAEAVDPGDAIIATQHGLARARTGRGRAGGETARHPRSPCPSDAPETPSRAGCDCADRRGVAARCGPNKAALGTRGPRPRGQVGHARRRRRRRHQPR